MYSYNTVEKVLCIVTILWRRSYVQLKYCGVGLMYSYNQVEVLCIVTILWMSYVYLQCCGEGPMYSYNTVEQVLCIVTIKWRSYVQRQSSGQRLSFSCNRVQDVLRIFTIQWSMLYVQSIMKKVDEAHAPHALIFHSCATFCVVFSTRLWHFCSFLDDFVHFLHIFFMLIFQTQSFSRAIL